jgi:hypothetical protein
LPAGSDSPQNKILQGIRPRRTRPCGVSDPGELSLAGCQTPQNNGKSCVHFIAYTCSAGSDTPQNNVLRGLIQTPRNKVLRGIRPRRIKSCGVSDPAEQWLELCTFYSIHLFCGSDTPQKNVLRGINPRGTTLKNKYFCEFEKEFKNILGCEFGDYMGSIHRKNRGKKSRATVPLKQSFVERNEILQMHLNIFTYFMQPLVGLPRKNRDSVPFSGESLSTFLAFGFVSRTSL